MGPWLSSAATHEQTAQTWPRLCWLPSSIPLWRRCCLLCLRGYVWKTRRDSLREWDFSPSHTLYTSPLPTPRRHKTSASILAFVGGRLHTRHTAHESYAYRLLRQKKKIYNSEEARARDEGGGTVQIRDLEPTTALSFGQGQRSSMHCIRAVSDPQRFSPPKPLSTFRAISMMTSIEQSSMAVSVNHRSRTAAGSARGSPPVHARELALQCMQRIAKGAVNARGGLSFQNRGPLQLRPTWSVETINGVKSARRSMHAWWCLAFLALAMLSRTATTGRVT